MQGMEPDPHVGMVIRDPNGEIKNLIDGALAENRHVIVKAAAKPTRSSYAEASIAAMVWEDDWQILLLVTPNEEYEERRRRYFRDCHDRLMEQYGCAPHPFDQRPA